MLIFRKNKILTLLFGACCFYSHAEVTIPIKQAYKQLTTTINYSPSSPQSKWVLKTTTQITPERTVINTFLSPIADASVAYTDITVPESHVVQLTVPFEVEHVGEVACPTGGDIAFVNKATKEVYVATVTYDGGNISITPPTKIPNSSATGDSITLRWDVVGNHLVTWNRLPTGDPTNALVQFAHLDVDGIPTTNAINGFLESDYSGTVEYAEVVRAAYLPSDSKWIVAQNAYTNGNSIGAMYGDLDLATSTFTSRGNIPQIDGTPAMVLEATKLDNTHVAFSTANSPYYTSHLYTGQLLSYDGSSLAALGASFESRPVFQRLQKQTDPQTSAEIARLHAVEAAYATKLCKVSSTALTQEQEFDSTWLKDLVEQKDTSLDAFTFGKIPTFLSNQFTHEWYVFAALTDNQSRRFQKLAASLTASKYHIKTHTRRKPNKAYSTHLRLLQASNNSEDQRAYLSKKYTTLQRKNTTTNVGNPSTSTSNPKFTYVDTPFSGLDTWGDAKSEIHQHILSPNGTAVQGQHIKTLQSNYLYNNCVQTGIPGLPAWQVASICEGVE